jgi:hypothetical protein
VRAPATDEPHIVALLTWRAPLPTDEEIAAAAGEERFSLDYGEQYAYQASRPIAVDLFHALRGQGHPTDCDTPYHGEGGWHFRLRAAGLTYSLFVQWVVLGNDEQWFSIYPAHRRPWRDAILRRPRQYKPICEALQLALANMPLVGELIWLTEREFEAVYSKDAPLPHRDPPPNPLLQRTPPG